MAWFVGTSSDFIPPTPSERALSDRLKNSYIFYTLISRGRIVVIAEACPPPDMGRGRGPTETSGR